MWKQFKRINGWRKGLVATGVVLITVGLTGLFMVVTEKVPSVFAVAFESLDVRTIAGVAIAGCLLAAIGFWEQ